MMLMQPSISIHKCSSRQLYKSCLEPYSSSSTLHLSMFSFSSAPKVRANRWGCPLAAWGRSAPRADLAPSWGRRARLSSARGLSRRPLVGLRAAILLQTWLFPCPRGQVRQVPDRLKTSLKNLPVYAICVRKFYASNTSFHKTLQSSIAFSYASNTSFHKTLQSSISFSTELVYLGGKALGLPSD